MDSKDMFKISVRNLVEFVMQSGDIISGFCSTSRMTDAVRAHQVVQKSSGDNYSSEVPVSYVVESDDVSLEVNGRIDGIIRDGDDVIIDEIKTTTADLDEIDEDYNPLHFAQAKCYAFIFAAQNSLLHIGVQLTYYHMNSEDTKKIIKYFELAELAVFFDDLVLKYLKRVRMVRRWQGLRDDSIKKLQFPFPSYRKGQREFAVSVYRSIRDKSKLFAQAPTGIGKTISALFPAVKALGEGLTTKIFYLTARTTTRAAAENAFDMMRKYDLKIKTLTLTAKDKVCLSTEKQCHPDFCEFAKGYYDRVAEAVEDIFSEDSFTREIIEEYAKKHFVCPFEFSLDLALYSDCIICDYNYAFDPRVYLKRFFMDIGGDYCFLIDEAHNLVDRSREMYSANLDKKAFLDLKRDSKDKDKGIYKNLKAINDYMIKLRKECHDSGEEYMVKEEPEKDLYPLLRRFIDSCDNYLKMNTRSPFLTKLLDIYFETAAFLKISEYYDERYVTFIERLRDGLNIKLFCVDPSYVMGNALKRCRSAIFFSATLSPMDYFIKTFGGDEKSKRLRLPSPYPRDNLCLMINNRISTKYRVRELTYDRISELIQSAAAGKTGNYLVYFPSYKYMDEIYRRFCEKNPGILTICQKPGMTDEEREDFLESFSSCSGSSLVGFAVMGGVFGEGIDLVGDRLSGAVVIGVGLPQVCAERDVICRYFQNRFGLGFEYAYIYPGINRVMQAVGRVIRSENDRGIALLIDERFTVPAYRDILPAEWNPKIIIDTYSLSDTVNTFWEINK